MTETKAERDRQTARIDQLERNWDRFAGPIVFMLAVLGLVATGASILSAVVVLGKS